MTGMFSIPNVSQPEVVGKKTEANFGNGTGKTEASQVSPEVSAGTEPYTGMKAFFARYPDELTGGKWSTSAPFLPWRDDGRYGRGLVNSDWPSCLGDLLVENPLSEKGKLTRLGLLMLAEYEQDCSTRVGVFIGQEQIGVNEINPPAIQKKEWQVKEVFMRLLRQEKLREAKELFGVTEPPAKTAIAHLVEDGLGEQPNFSADDNPEDVVSQALAKAQQHRGNQDAAIGLVTADTFALLDQTQDMQGNFTQMYLANMEAAGVQLGVQGFNAMMTAAATAQQELMKRAAQSQQSPGKGQAGGSGASPPQG